MWRKSQLGLFNWSRYIVSRKYSTQKPGQTVSSTPNSEEKITELLEDAANFNEATDTSWNTSPYPDGAVIPSEQPKRPRQDPQETSIVIFPGQGTIKVGQVKEYLCFPRVDDLFKVANDVLGYDLLDICVNGPQEKLDRCEFNQVATTAVSLAAAEKFREERPAALASCKSVAGYSVGEISALMFAGGLSLEDGFRLAGIRGAAMQLACDTDRQGMVSAFFKPTAKLSKVCQESTQYAMDLGVTDPVCR